jgi:GNAT superfamily N-acetyltransferase
MLIRPLGEPGDLGWVVMAHGEVYAAEYGWGSAFEEVVAGIVGDYARKRDPAREAAWIAEVDGRRAGCVFCVSGGGDVAKLRILLVDPAFRGHGLGAGLVGECLSFATAAGYRRITLWTNKILTSARHIYQAAGFTLDDEAPHDLFGPGLVEQNWSRNLP